MVDSSKSAQNELNNNIKYKTIQKIVIEVK